MDENAYKKELEAITNMQKQQLVQNLDRQKQSDLSTIDRQVAVAKPQFQQQRLDKNVGSQIQKLNFAEFLQRRGQTNSGFANQAELSRQNNLSRNIGAVDTAENQFNTDMTNRRADIQSNYSNQLLSGQSGIQQNMADRLLGFKEQLRQEALQKQLRDLEFDRQTSEQQRRERVQAQNDALAYQRQLELARQKNTSFSPQFSDTIANQPTQTPRQTNEFEGYDMNSIMNLGYGAISKAKLKDLVNSGQVIARNENGRIVVSKAPTGLSFRGFGR